MNIPIPFEVRSANYPDTLSRHVWVKAGMDILSMEVPKIRQAPMTLQDVSNQVDLILRQQKRPLTKNICKRS